MRYLVRANLERMLGHMAKERGKRSFGKCPSCAHLECEHRGMQHCLAYACGLMRQPLEPAELGEFRVNIAPGKDSTTRHALSG